MMQLNSLDTDLARNTYLELCADFTRKSHQTYDFVLSHFLGKAFVSFQYQHYAFAVLNYHATNPIYLDGNRLDLQPATAPRDVFWENMNVTDNQRRNRKVVSFFITLGALLIVFGILVGLYIVQAMGLLAPGGSGGPGGQGGQGGQGGPGGPPGSSKHGPQPAANEAPSHMLPAAVMAIIGTAVMIGMSLFVNFINGALGKSYTLCRKYHQKSDNI
jgi:hypothetical protein